MMVSCLIIISMTTCTPPAPKESGQLRVKNNFIVLLDLSDRIIMQPDQLQRDKEIIRHI